MKVKKLKKEFFKFKIFGLSCFLLSSCASYPSLYLSSSQNVPMLTEKHEARLEAGTGTQNIGVQAAYAITNHFEVMTSYSYGQAYFPNLGPISDGSTTPGFRNGGDFAIGYFSKLDSSASFEIFGGMERYYRSYTGDSYSSGYPDNYMVSTNITKPFLQADIGFRLGKRVQLGVSCRAGYLIYDKLLENDIQVLDSNIKVKARSYANILNTPIVEPAVTLRFGRKNLKVMLQYGLSITSLNYPANLSLFYGFGLSYSLAGKIHK